MSSSFVDVTANSEAEGLVCVTAPGDDGALVVAAKNGNEKAFEVLVERYRLKLGNPCALCR